MICFDTLRSHVKQVTVEKSQGDEDFNSSEGSLGGWPMNTICSWVFPSSVHLAPYIQDAAMGLEDNLSAMKKTPIFLGPF